MDVPQDVIEACQRGEPLAFEQLIKLTHKDVYSLSLRLVGNPDDAAEVSQETYLKLLRVIKSFRGDSKFSTWLFRVTSNVAISMLRKRAKQRLDVPMDSVNWNLIPTGDQWDPAEQAERSLDRSRLESCLVALPTGYRTVVVMKDMYGFSLDEIGKQLGITEGAAKVRLFRARQRLKDMLYEDGPARYRDRKEGIDGVS